MSKLEVREIGPISGETDLKLGQSGGTVTLADGANAIGFGGGGKVLQVVQEVYSTQTATSSDSYVTSGLQASITPSSTSSKILVIAKVTAFYNSGGGGDPTGGSIALFRDGANILDRCASSYSQFNGLAIDAGVNFMDSPNSTASLNYEIRFKSEFGTGNQFCHDNDTPSTMILMEVLA